MKALLMTAILVYKIYFLHNINQYKWVPGLVQFRVTPVLL